MTISTKQKQHFRSQAHHLKPVIIIGSKGLTEAVQLEIERALLDHELIKIKINHNDREERKKITDEICKARKAELMQVIGQITVIYRKNED